MLDNYNCLSDQQMINIDYFLDRADSNRLEILHQLFMVKRARRKIEYRENIIRDLRIEQVPFDYFLTWLCHIELEGNNSLFVYEPEDEKVFSKINLNSLYEENVKKITPLYDINIENLNEIKLVDVIRYEEKNQVLFTIAAPSQIQYKSLDGRVKLRDHVYLAYITVDFEINSIILSMHPTSGLVSIYGETGKRREIDDLTWIILHFFRNNILQFTLKEPKWIIDALSKISDEYFYHNNPIIEEKTELFSNEIIPEIMKKLKELDSTIDREDSFLRLERGLTNLYENEMLIKFKRIQKDIPFSIFLQQTDKGLTQFKANTRGKALSHAEAGEIIRLMWEHGEVLNFGLIHKENFKEYGYIIKKLDKYYSFKKYTTSGAEKEVIDNVLRKLNKYKEEAESNLTDSETEEFELGADDFKA
ncbi:hypothetical protein [Cytobacillus gottheilii]|uniref:hypothetical protein n=1 Tax=Cytobacillus gottheilii TaxID=859144 RepID=UPI000829AD14|nr:hypothetical protein [Cytobacillus gottheilii]